MDLFFALARATGTMLVTLFGAITLAFALISFAPGDAIDSLPDSLESRASLEQEWNLAGSYGSRLVRLFSDLAAGDLQTSLVLKPGQPVDTMLWSPALTSLTILSLALLLAVFTSMATGASSVFLKRSAPARLLSIFSLLPVFLFGHILITVINQFTWMLIQGESIARPSWFALPVESSMFRTWLAVVVLAGASASVAEMHTSFHNIFNDIRNSDYVLATMGRGGSITPHVFANTLVPAVSLCVQRIPVLLSSMVILERIFNIQGVGALFWYAAIQRDYPVLMGVCLLSSVVIIVTRWILQIFELFVDPRIRLATT